jgi:hypothetical protein
MAKSDKKVLDLIAEVNRQKEEIGKAERPVWATNCSFTFAFAIPLEYSCMNTLPSLCTSTFVNLENLAFDFLKFL